MLYIHSHASFYAPKFQAIDTVDDCDTVAETVGYPVFIKPSYGVAAYFASKVHSVAECKEKTSTYWNTMDANVCVV